VEKTGTTRCCSFLTADHRRDQTRGPRRVQVAAEALHGRSVGSAPQCARTAWCRFSRARIIRSPARPDRFDGKCGRCEFRRICGGSRARAYATTGSPFASDPVCVYEPGAGALASP